MVAKSIGAALIDILGIKTTVPCNFDKVQHTAGLTFNSNVQHATYNMQRTACNAQHATCSMQHAAYPAPLSSPQGPHWSQQRTGDPPVRTAERVSPSAIALNLCRANRWLPWHRWMLCYLAFYLSIASKSPHDLASCEDEPHMDSKTRL
jgi:hypothetical protein